MTDVRESIGDAPRIRLTYVATPYSHPDPAVREERADAAARALAWFLRLGRLAFSPVAHSHAARKISGPRRVRLLGGGGRWTLPFLTGATISR